MMRAMFRMGIVMVLIAGWAARVEAQESAALGPDSESQALAFMDKGTTLFKGGDYDGALLAFTRATELASSRPNPYRWLGLTLVRLEQCPAAIAAFDRFLSMVPDTDARTVEAQTLRDRCRSELRPKVGTLIVDTRPAGAEVQIGESPAISLGVTPAQSDAVPIGAHVVHVHKAGYRDVARSVQVGKNETVRLALDLELVDAPPKRRVGLIVGVTVGVVVVVGLGLGLGLGFGLREQTPVLPPVGSMP